MPESAEAEQRYDRLQELDAAEAWQMSLPDHPFNDPDRDGHTCVDCATESIWKCDAEAHSARDNLRKMARDRRRALDESLAEPIG